MTEDEARKLCERMHGGWSELGLMRRDHKGVMHDNPIMSDWLAAFRGVDYEVGSRVVREYLHGILKPRKGRKLPKIDDVATALRNRSMEARAVHPHLRSAEYVRLPGFRDRAIVAPGGDYTKACEVRKGADCDRIMRPWYLPWRDEWREITGPVDAETADSLVELTDEDSASKRIEWDELRKAGKMRPPQAVERKPDRRGR